MSSPAPRTAHRKSYIAQSCVSQPPDLDNARDCSSLPAALNASYLSDLDFT